MADSGTGIQELMAAETRASQIVAEARIGESPKDFIFCLRALSIVDRNAVVSLLIITVLLCRTDIALSCFSHDCAQ